MVKAYNSRLWLYVTVLVVSVIHRYHYDWHYMGVHG